MPPGPLGQQTLEARPCCFELVAPTKSLALVMKHLSTDIRVRRFLGNPPILFGAGLVVGRPIFLGQDIRIRLFAVDDA
ncbi:hypothetical protein D3C85_1791600 [compost metagenome]